jgi:hypothetical protein
MRRANLYPALLALALLLPALPGCASLPRCPEELPGCPEIPACSRNRVYVFLVAGIDPLCEMEHLRERLIECGFIKVYCGHRLLGKHYAEEIQRLHQCDEHARFVLVSQGSASGVVRDIALNAGTPIDLVVFLDGTGEGPTHAGQALFIHGEKDVAADDKVAELSVCLADASWLGTAKHPQTAALIVKELCAVAARIPIIERGPKCDLIDCPPCGGGWDFLRPDGNDSGCVRCKPLADALFTPPAPVLAQTPPPQEEKPRVIEKPAVPVTAPTKPAVPPAPVRQDGAKRPIRLPPPPKS